MSSSFAAQHRSGAMNTGAPFSQTFNPRPPTSEGRNGAASSSSSSSSLAFNNNNKWQGAQSIWSNSTFGPAPSTVRPSSGPRSSLGFGVQNGNPSGKDTIEGKKGSGQLVDSSISDDCDFRGFPKLNGPFSKPTETSFSQNRSNSNSGLPQAFAGATRNSSSFSSSRPTTSGLSATASAAPKPPFSGSFDSPMAYMSDPPHVYTKYNKPAMPKQPDSAFGGEWGDGSLTHSPVEDRRRPSTNNFFGLSSAPSSRNNSLPPSRHSDIQPTYPIKSDAFSSSQQTPPFRGASFSSTSRPSGSFSTADVHTNPLAQFSHLGLQDDGQNLALQRQSFSGPSLLGQSSSAYNRNGSIEHPEDVETIDRQFPPAFANDSYAVSNQANDQASFRLSQYNDRSTTYGNSYNPRTTGSSGSSFQRPYQANQAVQPANSFPTAPNPDAAAFIAQRYQTLPDHVDPRHLMNMHLQSPYAYFNPGFYPYHFANGAAMHRLPAYPAMPSHAPLDVGSAMGIPKGPRDFDTGHSLRSVCLENFKNDKDNKSRRGGGYELKDIFDHVVEFSGDQHGSRFIQQKLETANSDDKERLFREISPNAIQLMTDVFGNYVIQKFFEHGDQNQKKVLANKMKGRVLDLSLQMYGCRVVQKALEHILNDQQAMLVHELEKDVLRCVKDQNGNHVIQKAIERCEAKDIAFIFQAFTNQIQHLSVHTYGCRVIQRCLENCEPTTRQAILAELHDCMPTLIGDSFGNYVAQHVVEFGFQADRQRVLGLVLRGLEGYSKHKFASNVVEKCLTHSDEAWRREVIEVMMENNQREGESMLLGLIKDQYGNYVLQKLLVLLNQHDFDIFVEVLQPEFVKAKRSTCGKQLVAIEKSLQRSFDRQLQAHSTTYGSRNISQNTTPPPPPLTADTRSLQTSSVGSVNGDALEGATSSRKGSVQHTEPTVFEC